MWSGSERSLYSHSLRDAEKVQSAIHPSHHLAGSHCLQLASYLDAELEGLVQFKYREKKKEEPRKHTYRKHALAKKEQEEEDFPPLE